MRAMLDALSNAGYTGEPILNAAWCAANVASSGETALIDHKQISSALRF